MNFCLLPFDVSQDQQKLFRKTCADHLFIMGAFLGQMSSSEELSDPTCVHQVAARPRNTSGAGQDNDKEEPWWRPLSRVVFFATVGKWRVWAMLWLSAALQGIAIPIALMLVRYRDASRYNPHPIAAKGTQREGLCIAAQAAPWRVQRHRGDRSYSISNRSFMGVFWLGLTSVLLTF